MKKGFGLRINLLIVFLILSLIAISPKFDISGVEIKSLDQVSKSQGLSVGEVVKEINGVKVNTAEEFGKLLKEASKVEPVKIDITTDKSKANYFASGDLKFELENLTIKNSNITGIKDGEILKEIKGNKIESENDFESIRYDLLPKKVIRIKTNEKEYVFQTSSPLEINVKKVSRTNLKKGLELEGGTRVLLKPVGEEKITDQDINNLISVIRNRLNVYGLTDLKIRAAQGGGEKFVLIEVAGIPKEEIEGFIAKQGKFEAKIGDETVFVGGKENIPRVCKDDGTCSGIRSCEQVSESEARCGFEFAIKLSPEAAKKHADVTRNIDVVVGADGKKILSKQIEFYLDGKLVDSLNIAADLKGSEATDILITGPGAGATEQEALQDALTNMEKLQVVLISGSLPFKLEISKIDSLSPMFGENFVKNAFMAGGIAILGVLGVIFIRYRKLKVILPMAITLLSEIFIILGFAAAIGWNLDLASIAGIIASVGTGVDDQIVIVDEILKGTKEKFFSWTEKIKRAFYIILVAYACTVVAMLPLWSAVAGLLRGFAITTIAGVTIGVLVTRPAFGSMLEKIMNK